MDNKRLKTLLYNAIIMIEPKYEHEELLRELGIEESEYKQIMNTEKGRFVLIATCDTDREIVTTQYEYMHQAQEAMRKQFEDAGGSNMNESDSSQITSICAWVTDGVNGANYDWKIVEVND